MWHLKLSNYLLVIVKLEFGEKEHFNHLLAWDTLFKIDFKREVTPFLLTIYFHRSSAEKVGISQPAPIINLTQ